MAKSKSGGSRAYIRGKLGADVYSIGKDGKGKKQQVVRSLAETVKNPQTINQMRGRMIMSTVMQAQSVLSFIVDHSFDGVPAGQPSLSEFISQNYALIKADVAAHPSSGNQFGMVKYQEKGCRGGAYVVANGSAVLPSNVAFSCEDYAPEVQFTGLEAGFTAGAFRAALGLAVGDYFTLVWISTVGKPAVAHRLKVSDTLGDDVVISNANAAQLFDVESINAGTSDALSFALAAGGNALTVSANPTDMLGAGLILSQQKNGAWQHNKCTLIGLPTNVRYTADVALPTYPVGEERFLNGGEL